MKIPTVQQLYVLVQIVNKERMKILKVVLDNEYRFYLKCVVPNVWEIKRVIIKLMTFSSLNHVLKDKWTEWTRGSIRALHAWIIFYCHFVPHPHNRFPGWTFLVTSFIALLTIGCSRLCNKLCNDIEFVVATSSVQVCFIKIIFQ